MISLLVEKLGEILNLHHEDIILESRDKGYNYNHKIVTSFLMKNPTPYILNSFTYGYIYTNGRMIQNNIFFSRKSKFGLITQVDVESIWIIEKKIKLNWANQVTKYMIGSKNKELCLSYRNMITKILEQAKFNFREEGYIEDVTKIGKIVLYGMRFDLRSSMEK